ncbi:RIP metalloprotease RseP [Anaerolentibacter hominis]|uniref:RIP metalloprotease RseP n=1 Tax=Anaerolentibacter hominis TaxID=3079009 RepID=UPI0031B8105B
MKIIIAILVFGLIIFFHELGHFLLAKKNGITVTEFSLGMGPRLCSFERGGTRYSLKLFPIGGSCMMLGEDELVEDEGAFNKKGVWARISVIIAGPVFNFILAFFMALIVIGVIGYDPAVVMGVEENAPFAEAGIQEGDVITRFDGRKIYFARELNLNLQLDPLTDEEVTLTYERNGEKQTVTLTPQKTESGSYRLGFSYSMYNRQKTGPLGTVKYAALEVRYWIQSTIKSIGMLIRGQVSKDDIAGPVGIVDMIGDSYEQSKPDGPLYVLLNILNISILLSANLGVMNLLPIPALDGGRLVFLLLEAVRGKPINQEKEGLIHMIGLIALLILMAFIVFNDFSRIFSR